jgi:tRNA (guanine-N7-)-methyltransferase
MPPDDSTQERETARRDAFFGRRKGHPLRAHQARLFQTLLPKLALDVSQPPQSDLAALFPRRMSAVRLEIGFGGAEHLLAQAEASPDTGFVGCEPFVNGMAKALAGIEARSLDNVRLYHGDAAELIAWLPDASLARIDLLYADPWPKRRHWKRRFVQPERIAAFARLLRPGGALHFASDWPDYVAWTLARFLQAHDFEWTAERADDWRQAWPGYAPTRYEAKARREGRTPTYLVFRRR